MSFSLLQDFDCYGHPRLTADELLELIIIDIQRIFFLLGPRMGKVAVIRRSQNGFHVSYPFAEITEEETAWLMESSPLDTGFAWWVVERGCSTLRISEKVILKEVGEKPWTKRFVGKKVIHDIPFILKTIQNPYI